LLKINQNRVSLLDLIIQGIKNQIILRTEKPKVKKEEEKDGKMTLQISSTGLVFGYFL